MNDIAVLQLEPHVVNNFKENICRNLSVQFDEIALVPANEISEMITSESTLYIVNPSAG